MAPPENGRRTVVFHLILFLFALMQQYQVKAVKGTVHPRPAKPDPPLKLNAPKPTFTNAKQSSAFGFRSRAPSDEAPDSDVDMEQGSVASAAERLAAEIYKHSTNVGESHKFLPYLIILSLKYLLLDDYDDIYEG